ncbi:MAG: MMPL family transporter [Candidatus Nitrohelix vancouverensis]|uniref:MMPL family transporter n=1 Tax=Candidatus Nitrohelix vancouverensis TaxID=2705534 RepID=A0A7T0C319_9BACT|nr:MAG: MMPL family transporter [Candidatus Nitrohelix vancouverensis]
MAPRFLNLFDALVLKRPLLTLLLVGCILGFFAFHTPDFRLDASADSLVLENDTDLKYFRHINKKYGSEDFLIITYTPRSDLLSDESLEGIRKLRVALEKMERVSSVTTILDSPLLNSPKLKLSEIGKNVRTLEATPDLDRDMALKEFTESPVYSKLLVSPNGKTTAILVNYKRDETYYSLLEERNDLREIKRSKALSPQERERLNRVSREFKLYLAEVLRYQNDDIKEVRRIMDTQRHRAEMFLGGVPMITSDMVRFIDHDISVFGMGVLFFMIIALGFFFRKVRWVFLPIAGCFLTTFVMVGVLGFLDWRVTVISSNFISILLIITMSLTIHLIVRYGELYAESPNRSQRELVLETIQHMFLPCFYTAITTIAAFTSLVVSGIRPVIDFGWMMTIGISMAFILSFLFFPACLALLSPSSSVSSKDITKNLTNFFAELTLKRRSLILALSVLLAVFCITGISRLHVENRFIDYFNPSTEIYQGMSVIDQQLGGTTPLDIVIDAEADFFDYLEELKQQEVADDPFDDPFGDNVDKEPENFWFHPEPLLLVEEVHDYLEGLPEIGKTLSIATTVKVLKILNDKKLPDDYDLALIRKLLPVELKKIFMHPYLAKDGNQVRISMRIEEVNPNLDRGALIAKIKKHLVEEIGIEEERIHFTGMAVLYNNMLHSLYQSQILTIGTVFIGILAMFIILFRKVFISLLAIIPNTLAAGMVLGIMGWFKIPLDMMTITIAAITIGIAVDDTIHYIYRFQEEFPKTGNYKETVRICHGSIGRAIYYTSITVTFGFSILALSNFIPTIYFGILTGVAMVVALLNNLTLLPALILLFKPLGPERIADK